MDDTSLAKLTFFTLILRASFGPRKVPGDMARPWLDMAHLWKAQSTLTTNSLACPPWKQRHLPGPSVSCCFLQQVLLVGRSVASKRLEYNLEWDFVCVCVCI